MVKSWDTELLSEVAVCGFLQYWTPALRPRLGSRFLGEAVRHQAAVRGGGQLLLGVHAELVTGISTMIRQLVPR